MPAGNTGLRNRFRQEKGGKTCGRVPRSDPRTELSPRGREGQRAPLARAWLPPHPTPHPPQDTGRRLHPPPLPPPHVPSRQPRDRPAGNCGLPGCGHDPAEPVSWHRTRGGQCLLLSVLGKAAQGPATRGGGAGWLSPSLLLLRLPPTPPSVCLHVSVVHRVTLSGCWLPAHPHSLCPPPSLQGPAWPTPSVLVARATAAPPILPRALSVLVHLDVVAGLPQAPLSFHGSPSPASPPRPPPGKHVSQENRRSSRLTSGKAVRQDLGSTAARGVTPSSLLHLPTSQSRHTTQSPSALTRAPGTLPLTAARPAPGLAPALWWERGRTEAPRRR